MTWLTVIEYLCHKVQHICSVCRNHNPVLSSLIIYHWVFNKGNTKVATSVAGTAYLSGAPQPYVFCVMYCISLHVHLWLFLLAIVLSVLLWFTTSDYPLWYLQSFRKVIEFCIVYCNWCKLTNNVFSSPDQFKF